MSEMRIEAREPALGDVVGGYRIESMLGRGGMGVVYRATQLALGRAVALKVLLPEHAVRQGAAARFEREARVSGALRHPNAIEVYDFGAADGYLYLAMELLVGNTLRSEVGDGDLVPPARAMMLASDIAGVLVAAHERGIVHRDLKPENVFLERQTNGLERLVVVDFGLAFVVDHEQLGRLTTDGAITGTPDYLAPEQIAAGATIGPEADVYALGCMLFEMLVGTTPFHGHPMRVLVQHTHAAPPSFDEVRRDPSIPRALEALVQSMLLKRPAERPTAVEVKAELSRIGGDGHAPERARDRTGLDGRAARMISAIRPAASQATTLDGDAMSAGADVAVIGMLEGDLVLGMAVSALRLFIVSPEQPIGDAAAIYAPGADLGTLTALRAQHRVPIVTDALPSDPHRVPALLRAGIDDVVMAPARAEELARRMWKLIRRSRRTEERKRT
ncbi:MAG: serine/threonine-protein kinase [Sandaracinus sp.]